MRRRYSIIRNPAFQKIALIIGFFLFCTFYWNFKTGGIISGIEAGSQFLFNLGYGFIVFTYLLIIIAWTFYKWEILIAVGIPIAVWIGSFFWHKRR
jgi:hypothetical protein